MNILVTGGAGYIGSVLCERLINEGHSVSIIDNFSTGKKDNIHPGCVLYECDIAHPDKRPEAFKQAFVRKDLVIHLAAEASVDADADKCWEVNMNGGYNVYRQMIKKECPNIIFASSAAVYGKYDRLISEDDELKPINNYGHTKLLFEQYLRYANLIYPINYTIFRLFNVTGATAKHGENRTTESHLINRLIKDEAINIYGTDHPTRDGTCIRDYVHVSDVVDAIILTIKKGCTNNIYNLSNGLGYTVKEIIDITAKVLSHDINAKALPSRYVDPHILIGDSSKAQVELGWQPKKDILDIINDTWRWIDGLHVRYS